MRIIFTLLLVASSAVPAYAASVRESAQLYEFSLPGEKALYLYLEMPALWWEYSRVYRNYMPVIDRQNGRGFLRTRGGDFGTNARFVIEIQPLGKRTLEEVAEQISTRLETHLGKKPKPTPTQVTVAGLDAKKRDRKAFRWKFSKDGDWKDGHQRAILLFELNGNLVELNYDLRHNNTSDLAAIQKSLKVSAKKSKNPRPFKKLQWSRLGRPAEFQYAAVPAFCKRLHDKANPTWEVLNPSPRKGKKASNEIEGAWRGVVESSWGKFAISIKLFRNKDGALESQWCYPEQGETYKPIQKAAYQENTLKLYLSEVDATFKGDFDGSTITGQWTQGETIPLTLTRHSIAGQLTFEERSASRVPPSEVMAELRTQLARSQEIDPKSIRLQPLTVGKGKLPGMFLSAELKSGDGVQMKILYRSERTDFIWTYQGPAAAGIKILKGLQSSAGSHIQETEK